MENNDTITATRADGAIRTASAERGRGAGRGSCWRAAAAVAAAWPQRCRIDARSTAAAGLGGFA